MKILIAIDDSPFSFEAIKSVSERTWPEQTEFRFISVVEPPFAQYAEPNIYVVESILQAQQAALTNTMQLVADEVEKLKTKLEREVEGTVKEGDIASAIVQEAKSWQADLIVLGSHGRKGLSRLFLGSVANKVAQEAPCSVEIVKQKQVMDTEEVESLHTASFLQSRL